MLRITWSTIGDQDSLRVIEIAFPIMGLVERSRVVVPKAKVEGQLMGDLEADLAIDRLVDVLHL